MPTATSDADLARQAADEAGRVLLAVRERLASEGRGGRELKDAGDRSAQEALAAFLAEHRPEDAVLSEEAADDPVRLTSRRVWIVDPLDGTREFSEVGGDGVPARTDWAVHVALWEDGELVAGAVAMPAAGTTYSTDPAPQRPEGAPDVVRLAVSRSRPPAFVTALAEELGAELVPMGSAGVKATSVLRDEADAYVHAGGQYEWDSAAPVAVARAAGLHTSRVDGSPLVYNRPDPTLPDLVVARPEVAERVLAAIARVAARPSDQTAPTPETAR
ncbi:3'(2'),5'-bisphosphate nucleotidase CysQ [uncultured Pseudokineococcus sp.]|uniref:3'(2'),5'-bisphosphate nucleotidase CysQ n=1 Tax=uncultured Pseudokineococcus sp. TaxID=1642928 RepID=UPI0026314143|nr:3'(2'),5'-bisphosphate nucleotidase CysQ [uncultured Pseudokineococcus sp.]